KHMGAQRMKSPLRLNSALIIAAQKVGTIQKRSVPNQIEYWAELGRAVEHLLEPADIYAITQGLKKITVEAVESEALNPEEVFASLEKGRSNGTLTEKLTSASAYYETSRNIPGLLDKVNTSTGERQTGRFQNGKFIPA
ncbi:ParD-like family protein, partial [Candidatus Dependentiae bacterium]|nr:ParD-like family protein [Candidatus Dependentiae bacterium]